MVALYASNVSLFLLVRTLKRLSKSLLAVAVVMAVGISALSVYVSYRSDESMKYMYIKSVEQSRSSTFDVQPSSEVQQVVTENIQGELRKGTFETVVQSLRVLVATRGGSVPVLNMGFDNDVWSGSMNCKVPTENVTSFTFDARQLISDHGKVTHITVNVVEQAVNQTGEAEAPMSNVSIGLRETLEGAAPVVNQLGMATSWLAMGLVWTAQGLILFVPLCFVCLGILLVVEKGIVPVWKREFKDKSFSIFRLWHRKEEQDAQAPGMD